MTESKIAFSTADSALHSSTQPYITSYSHGRNHKVIIICFLFSVAKNWLCIWGGHKPITWSLEKTHSPPFVAFANETQTTMNRSHKLLMFRFGKLRAKALYNNRKQGNCFQAV